MDLYGLNNGEFEIDMTESTGQGLLNIREAARYLGISHHTLYKLLERREVPAAKIGGSWRFNRATLDEFVASQSLVPRPRVLVIDPIKGDRDLLSDFALARAGQIDTVADADEAIRQLGRAKPDLVFVGAESAEGIASTVNKLREEGIDARIVVVAAPGDAAIASPAMEHGPVFLLPKPVDRDDVISILTLITH
ncbi:MAG: helix-turn-helix domain-containing protein [Chloroflexi bacterium]|nr:helix-turn-helix domain-containing protein [Chloroflexota bacterium]